MIVPLTLLFALVERVATFLFALLPGDSLLAVSTDASVSLLGLVLVIDADLAVAIDSRGILLVLVLLPALREIARSLRSSNRGAER